MPPPREQTRPVAPMTVARRARRELARPARQDPPVPPRTALEYDFPVEYATVVPTAESWRKELHRPATHVHGWWAHRLGTVFRAVLTAAVSVDADTARAAYLRPDALAGVRVYDPCAGSGTTLVETAKLGGTCNARDINPVATLVARQAAAHWDLDRLTSAFDQFADVVAGPISEMHVDQHGNDVLHYFWVARLPCPECGTSNDLHASHVFAKHAYPSKHPTGHAVCPHCDSITALDVTRPGRSRFVCSTCRHRPQVAGPFRGRSVTCTACSHRSMLSYWIDAAGHRPTYRMYAKLVVEDRQRVYRPVDRYDLDLYEHARQLLNTVSNGTLIRPQGKIADGYNTVQLLRWGITRWDQLYSARQAYCLGLAAAAVRDLEPSPEREALAALISGAADFHTRLTSYKGEGTGAVRHTFTNHTLQPQRTPIETHVWGVNGSSGGIQGLFERRLLRAHDYKQNPHDLTLDPSTRTGTARATGISASLNAADVTVECGDGADSGLADASIDLVVTDPPYIGKVHYSELADFFHAWLIGIRPYDGYPEAGTTRTEKEAQDPDPTRFASTAQRIWAECHRVLAAHGLLAFTFHHPDADGWIALLGSLTAAGFTVTGLQPVKGEMSSSVVKHQTADPSDLDIVVVARKSSHAAHPWPNDQNTAVARMGHQLATLANAGLQLRHGDVRACAYAAAIAAALNSDLDRHGSGRTDQRRHDRELLERLAAAAAETLTAPYVESV